MKKFVIQPRLMREVQRKMREIHTPTRERDMFEDLMKVYHQIVFLREGLWGYEECGKWDSLYEIMDKHRVLVREKSEGAERLYRGLEQIDKAVREGRSFRERYLKIVRSTGYKFTKHGLVELIEGELDDVGVPFSLGQIRGELKSVYFKSKGWSGAGDLSEETKEMLRRKIEEAESISEMGDVAVEEVQTVMKSIDQKELFRSRWSHLTEKEYDAVLLAGAAPFKGELEFYRIFGEDGYALSFRIPDASGFSNVSLSRDIYFDIKGNPVEIYNELFTKEYLCSHPGMGAKATFSQITQAYQAGVKKIGLEAAGDAQSDLVGYKVWPKFGYDGVFEHEQSYSRAKKNTTPEMDDYLKRVVGEDWVDIKFPISTFLSAVDKDGNNIGVEWWSKFGEGFDAEFDFSPRSHSMRVFSAYMRAKLEQYGLTLAEFLEMDIPIADTTSLNCWGEVIRNNLMEPEDMIKFIPDLQVALSNASDTEVEDFYEDLKDLHPKVYRALRVKRASSGVDPVEVSIWGEIGRGRLAQAQKVQALKLLNPADFEEIGKAEKKLK